MENKFETREQWLDAGIAALSETVFPEHTLPDGIRASCGFPSSKALSVKNRTVGECWERSASDGAKMIHVFISPVLGDAVEVLGVLSHELIHALKPTAGHRGPFKRIADSIGLVGKATATTVGPELRLKLEAIASELGVYPHARLNALGKEPKTQTTRLIKAECPCGSVIRITRKWIDAYAGELPTCPCGEQFIEADKAEEGN